MPELPEVETIRLQLQKYIIGKTIASVDSYHKKSLSGDMSLIIGKKIIGTKRYGKMLVLDVEGMTDIGIHLKMSGQLLYEKEPKPLHKHTRVVITFTDGTRLLFNDQRIFGWVRILPHSELVELSFVKKLGPEPWDISDKDFFHKIKTRNRAVKLVILDQEIISGVGNIYANDALWEAGIKPGKTAKNITQKEATMLREKIIHVLREGIRYGGTTGGDRKYVNLEGNIGSYQDHVRVYDREGESCQRKDGGTIEKIQLGGRGTYFCPVCQK
jgi:formamidopyrimidine-DNA glycosylase